MEIRNRLALPDRLRSIFKIMIDSSSLMGGVIVVTFIDTVISVSM